MIPKFVYFKELPLDDEKKFKLTLMENNRIENVKFLKNNKYLLTELKINPNIEYELTK